MTKNLSMAIKNIVQKQSDNVYESNTYFCPQLFEIIENYFYIIPLWTGIILNHQEQPFSKTSLTNNPVENWFGHLKNNVLKNRKVMPSQFVGSVYQILYSKFILYYNDSMLKSNFNKDIISKKINKIEKEKWKKGKKNKRQKGFYLKKTENFGTKLDSIRRNF